MLYQIIGVSLLEILMTIVLYQAINGIVKRLLYGEGYGVTGAVKG